MGVEQTKPWMTLARSSTVVGNPIICISATLIAAFDE
jgi:hypothetical protein